MKIIIDGKELEAKEGQSVLEAALDSGIYIPHLCGHPDLEAVGGCRLCTVEIEGMDRPVPSCKTTVREGLRVSTTSPGAEKTRKMAMELILATHPADCTGCPKYGKCELQSMYQYMGVGPERWRKKSRTVPTDESNPLIKHLFTRCIRCGRCVRACRELRGVKILDFQKTGEGVRIGIDGNVSLEEAGCRFCGACIEVCPTGSIMDAVNLEREDMSYNESIVPCRSACPAHTDIPEYLRCIKKGDYETATAIIREKIPFPEILGNICNHVCESECKRNELGGALSICRLKKAASSRHSDQWKEKRILLPPTGKKAAVIGAGPGGLTAAYYLAKKGHDVTVFEAKEKAGGQCRYGIPAYRLPDAVIDHEVEDMTEIGIHMQYGRNIQDATALLSEGYDAVLIAIGTHEGVRLPMEGNALEGVVLNTDFLRQVREGSLTRLKGDVVVLGGGNVAFDCGRTALRLGADRVHIACLESEDTMTATLEEREEGREEGIELHAAHSFLRITGTDHVEGVELKQVHRFYFDENKKAVIELVEGTEEIVKADHVIFAVGQRPKDSEQLGVELVRGTYVKADEKKATSVQGIFAAGDVVTGTRSVIEAVAQGRDAAMNIDRYLGGDGNISETLTERSVPDQWIGRIQGFGGLERLVPEMADAQVRSCNFDRVEHTFSNEEASCEAGRCLQCDLRLTLERPKLWNEY